MMGRVFTAADDHRGQIGQMICGLGKQLARGRVGLLSGAQDRRK